MPTAGTRTRQPCLAIVFFASIILALAVAPRPSSAQPSAFHGYVSPTSTLRGEAEVASAPPLPSDLASPEPERSPVAFDVALAAHVPLMLGGQATLELPLGFLVQTELGVLPGFSIDAVDSVLVSAGAYDEATSTIVRESLRDSFVFRLSAGMRPFPDHGFEFLGGYTLASLGGGVGARTAVEAVSGVAVPAAVPDVEIGVTSTVHAFHVGLGWRWLLAEHFVVRASLGYVQAVGSSSEIEVPSELAQDPQVRAGVTAANAALDEKLDDIYTTYVKMPLLGLSLGYRF